MQNLHNWNENHRHHFHFSFHSSFFFLMIRSVHSIYWYQQFFWLNKSWTILSKFSVLSHFSSWNFLFIETFYWLRQCMSIDWIDKFDRKYKVYLYACFHLFDYHSSYRYENRSDSDRLSAMWMHLSCFERSSFCFLRKFSYAFL